MTGAIEAAEFAARLQSPIHVEDVLAMDAPILTIRVGEEEPPGLQAATDVLGALPLIVIGMVDGPIAPGSAALADLLIDPSITSPEHIEAVIRRCPQAATTLVLLLRGAERRSIADGLVAESMAYSLLQAGPEFHRWRAERSEPRTPKADGAPIRVERHGDALTVTLSRPDVHNALNTAMRDALYEALTVAAVDPDVQVMLRGEGPSFCAGGDLSEFGSFPDPTSAHVIRLSRSIGRVISTMSGRVATVLHGACLGAGIELPAFGGQVVARPDARIGLPEIGLGLIPGAGGTVSVTRRIGRHRTALLALSGEHVDATTALGWGLVDEVQAGP